MSWTGSPPAACCTQMSRSPFLERSDAKAISDPSGDKATTQHGANRLAAIGLSALTVAPAQRLDRVRLQVIGGSTGREFAFCWPIWREPASLATIRALLSYPDLDKGQEALAYFGVVQVRRARRISVGKFMNFTRADIL